MDFMDRLDAEKAVKLARSHGNSNGILAFRDRLDANLLVEQYNHLQTALNPSRLRVGDRPEELLDYC